MNSNKALKAPPHKRRYVRFEPPPITMGVVDLGHNQNGFPSSEIAGLVTSESYGGCAMIVRSPNPIKVGSTYAIKIGEMNPLSADVCWIQIIEAGIMRVGFCFKT